MSRQLKVRISLGSLYALILLLALFDMPQILAQERFDTINIALPNTKGIDKDPRKLVNALIEDRKTEKEKFDAIFLWVAQHIKYNYATYNATKGHQAMDIKNVLRYKSGVCIDYANLMDTLCFLAGITNISVYGYSRDYLNDVSDSLYMDNHAWNVVRLNNLWYLYDVTWASGGFDLKMTKCSQWRYNWVLKLRKKIKLKHVNFKLKRKDKYKCNDLEKKVSYQYHKIRFIPKLLIRVMSFRKFKFYYVPNEKVNFTYYLTEPNFFSITHIPDVPYWSLLKYPAEIRGIEIDSSFYHFNNADKPKFPVSGQFCDDCNKYLTLSELEKLKETKRQSFIFNRRNRFVTSLCNYNLAKLNFKDAIIEKDSAAKIAFIDTTLSYLALDKQDLLSCVKNLRIEYRLQKNKNARKKAFLIKENKQHTILIQQVIKKSRDRAKEIKYFVVQFKSKIKSYQYVKRNILRKKQHLGNGTSNEKRRKNLIEKALQKCDSSEHTIDSLNPIIIETRKKFDEALLALSTHAWLKIKDHDSVLFSFYRTSIYRLGWHDSYKKLVVEERNELARLEKKYYNDINDNIYRWADSTKMHGKKLMNLIDLRNKQMLQSAQASKQLTELKHMQRNELYNRIDELMKQIDVDRCEYVQWFLNLEASSMALSIHKETQKAIASIILDENACEAERFHDINKEINWRLKKYLTVPSSNLVMVKAFQNHVKKYRKAFLKSTKKPKKKKR